MKQKIFDNEDISHERSLSMRDSVEQHAKSFAIFNNAPKFVNLSLPDIKLLGKQFYKKQHYCTICFRTFTTTFRQHHCRVCVNAVCNQCSRSMINKQRACDLCILKFTNIHEQKKKKQILQTLQLMCAYMIYRKGILMQELQNIKMKNDTGSQTVFKDQLKKQEEQILQLQNENKKYKLQKYELDQQLEKIRAANSQYQTSIYQIQRQIGSERQNSD